MKRNIFYLLLIPLLLAAACNQAKAPEVQMPLGNSEEEAAQVPTSPECSSSYNKKITVNQKELCVEMAATTRAQTLGLSNRPSMEENQGMLFIFSGAPTKPAFWMKDMRFDLDLIWIREGKIVDITKNVPAPKENTKDSDLPDYSPSIAVDQVLEVNAGWSDRNGVKVGDRIQAE